MQYTYFDLACNKKNIKRFLYYGLVSAETARRALAIDFTGKNVTSQEVNDACRVGFELSTSIMKFFWRLRPDFQRPVDEFVDKHFQGYFFIGLQIRTHFLGKNITEKFFIECAKKVKIGLADNESKLPVKWFVATDNSVLSDRLKLQYPDRVIKAEGFIHHIMLRKNAITRTLMNSELLSRCDELILTVESTFGWPSAMRSGRMPFMFHQSAPDSTSFVCKQYEFSNNLNSIPRKRAFV
jgi:hypothetical protein